MYDDASFGQVMDHQRLATYSSNEQVDIAEILKDLPESKNDNISISSPNPSAHTNNTGNDNVFIVFFSVIYALIFSQLQKLPISSRIIHQFLILHFILTSIGLSEYVMLYPANIINKYEIWRFITYSFADTNVFMGLIGCITLSDIIKRMEYYFGSLWTLYLFIINWLFISIFIFIIQYIFIMYGNNILPSLLMDNTHICIGLYPIIFSLYIIEISLSFPSQINHIFGIIYIPHRYHPIIYCILYNMLIRFDIATFIIVIYNTLLLYCIPSIYHLSRYTIQSIQQYKCLQCVVNDKLFISIENIDYDSFVSTRKYITAQSDKNTDLSLNANSNYTNATDQSYHSTMLLQRNLIQQNESDLHDGSDSEQLPFIINHSHLSHDSNLSNISSHRSDTLIHNNMAVNRKRG